MVEPAWTWSIHEMMPSTTDAGHKLIDQLMGVLTELGWSTKDLFHVQLAAEEAMVNAVKHGNKEAEDKVVEVEFKVASNATYVRIKDQGEGFSPEELPDPRDSEHLECTNGRGVMLMKEMMTEVQFNDSGNEVIMIKHREE
jgi:serine/threonine-protein kinase RsbW